MNELKSVTCVTLVPVKWTLLSKRDSVYQPRRIIILAPHCQMKIQWQDCSDRVPVWCSKMAARVTDSHLSFAHLDCVFQWVIWSSQHYFDGLVLDCSNSSANAEESLQSCTKPLISLVTRYCIKQDKGQRQTRHQTWSSQMTTHSSHSRMRTPPSRMSHRVPSMSSVEKNGHEVAHVHCTGVCPQLKGWQ